MRRSRYCFERTDSPISTIPSALRLAENCPRLGHLTFLDALTAIMFVVNALLVVYNVWLRRMEMAGRQSTMERIDRVLDWAYPLADIVSFRLVALWFS